MAVSIKTAIVFPQACFGRSAKPILLNCESSQAAASASHYPADNAARVAKEKTSLQGQNLSVVDKLCQLITMTPSFDGACLVCFEHRGISFRRGAWPRYRLHV